MQREYNTKYHIWYWKIIDRALVRPKPNEYTEKHHIVPRCLGGANDRSNLVVLTGREHYIVHLLLTKMIIGINRYKMIRALVRFAKKNGKSFELARIVISKSSTGKQNPSFGKRWAYDPNDHSSIIYNKPENIPSHYILGLPNQRGGHRGYIWANDGIVQTMMKKSEIILPWKKGRLHNPDIEHMKYMSSFRHTLENDEEHRQKLSGRIQIYNPETNASKRIHPTEKEKYISEGWIIKSVPNRYSKSCIIEGIKFETLASASRSFGIIPQVLTFRLKSNNERWKEWKYLP